MATAHLLETSEEDSFLLVGRFVGDLLNEGTVCRHLVVQNYIGVVFVQDHQIQDLYFTSPQERTALAETTGSKFVVECEAALGQQRYDHLLKLLTDKIDIILSKVDDGKGVYIHGAWSWLLIVSQHHHHHHQQILNAVSITCAT